jgi:hypothetical protein
MMLFALISRRPTCPRDFLVQHIGQRVLKYSEVGRCQSPLVLSLEVGGPKVNRLLRDASKRLL